MVNYRQHLFIQFNLEEKMATQIKIIVPGGIIAEMETFKWLRKFVFEDPAEVGLQATEQPRAYVLVSKDDNQPVSAPESLRKKLEQIEVELEEF